MKVAIVGCGAMGTIMGAYLTRGGLNVEMVDTYKEHVQTMRERGATVTGYGAFQTPVVAILPEEMKGIYDVVFLLTKQTANDVVLPQLLPHLGADSVVCTLQNGIPEPLVAKYIGEGRTVGGTMLWGATFEGPGVSRSTRDIRTCEHLFEIGEVDGSLTKRIETIAEILRVMGPTNVTTELMERRWYKLFANACMSGMSAACGCSFGDVLDNPLAAACLSGIGREVKRCCEAEGYQLHLDGVDFEVFELANEEQYEKTLEFFHQRYDCQLGAKASMLQDLEIGRHTEVSMINGYVCQVGNSHGIDTPFNDAVVAIVNEIEEKKLTLSMENLMHFPKLIYGN